MYLHYTPNNTTLALSCLIERTPSAPIHLSNKTGVFGHRAILMWGIEAWLVGFQLELSDTLQARQSNAHAVGRTLPAYT